MIVTIQRINSQYFRIITHHDGLQAWWLSPGAYLFLRGDYGYRPYEVEIVPEVVVYQMMATGHIRRLKDAPPTGSFQEPFRMAQQSQVCVIL